MSRKTHFNRINELLEDARNAIMAHHNLVDSKIAKYKKQQVENRERLNAETLEFEDKKDRAILQGDVRYSANSAIQSIELAFDDILAEITAWSIEPPSSDFLTLMQTVQTFNLELSIDEIKMLSQVAAGSYFSEKILSKFSERSGLRYLFETIDTLAQMIRNTKDDCVLAVKAYTGKFDTIHGMEFCTDELGHFPSFRRLFASEFLARDESSLARLQEALSTATNSSICLISGELERLAAMFDGVAPADRLDKMKSLIADHPELEKRLSVFDPDCFREAKKELRNQKEEERQNALAAVREASQKAMEAQKEALKASF